LGNERKKRTFGTRLAALMTITQRAPALVPIGVGLATTALVTVLSYALPPAHQATAVGLAFLAMTYVLVLRRDGNATAHHGLSLGGLFEPAPLSFQRIARETGTALAWAFGAAAVIFPLFWIGWVAWWKPESGFSGAAWHSILSDAPGQLLVIALPEEAFYRGYLQTALDDALPKRVRVLGADLGPSIVVTSALFALGHLATELDPNRLGVFFPSLLFGYLRVRTGGIGASVILHTLANLFTAFLARSYGFSG
jgi:membrane protease YdiL (CAAX protease family)